MPMTAAMRIVMSRLNVGVAAVPNGLRRVVIEVRRIVENRWTPVRKIGPATLPPVRARRGRVDTDMPLTPSPAKSVLSVGFAAKSNRQHDSKSDNRQKHFLFQHG